MVSGAASGDSNSGSAGDIDCCVGVVADSDGVETDGAGKSRSDSGGGGGGAVPSTPRTI